MIHQLIDFIREVYDIRDAFDIKSVYIKEKSSLQLSEICTTEFHCPINKIKLKALIKVIEEMHVNNIDYLDLSWNDLKESRYSYNC